MSYFRISTCRLMYTHLGVLPASVSVGRYGGNSSSGPTGSLATLVGTSPRAPTPGVTSYVFQTFRVWCLLHRQPLDRSTPLQCHSTSQSSIFPRGTGKYQLARWRSWWAPRLARSGLLQCSSARGNLACIPRVSPPVRLVPAPCPPARTPLTTASTSSVVVRPFLL